MFNLIQNSKGAFCIIYGERHDLPVLFSISQFRNNWFQLAKTRKVILLNEGYPCKDGNTPYTIAEVIRRELAPNNNAQQHITNTVFLAECIQNGIEIHGSECESTLPHFEREFFQRRLRDQIFTSRYLPEQEAKSKLDHIIDSHETHAKDVLSFSISKRTVAYDNAVIHDIKRLLELHPNPLIITVCGNDHIRGIQQGLENSCEISSVFLHDNSLKESYIKGIGANFNIPANKADYLNLLDSKQQEQKAQYLEIVAPYRDEIDLLNFIDARRSCLTPEENHFSILFSSIFSKVSAPMIDEAMNAAQQALKILRGECNAFTKEETNEILKNVQLSAIINDIPVLKSALNNKGNEENCRIM